MHEFFLKRGIQRFSYDELGMDLAIQRSRAELTLADVFESEVASVFGFLLTRCGSRSIAEDLTSLTFLAASEQFAAGKGNQVTGGWLRTVAARRLVDHWRSVGTDSRRFERLRNIARFHVDPPTEPNDDVLVALDSLPDRQRAVLVLRYLDDFSNAEIAEALNLSYKAVESLLARARASFRAAYSGDIDV